jgi:hypothetical protein
MKKTLDGENKPIFIISTARSGTTSLSNHLCQHSKIVGFLSEKHWGIKEIRFVDSWRYYFNDLKKDENLFYFIENFSISDEFLLSGLKKEVLYREKFRNMYDVINIFLKYISKQNNVNFLLINNPHQIIYLEKLVNNFPNAYYVVIKRDMLPTIKSIIKKYEKKSIFAYCKHILLYQSSFDSLDNEREKIKNLIEINFDDFIKKPKRNLKKIINFLDLEWEENVMNNPYIIHSSFYSKGERKTFFKNSDDIMIKLLNFIFKLVPYNFIKKPLIVWLDKMNGKKANIPPFKYRLNPNSKYLKGNKFQREEYKAR